MTIAIIHEDDQVYIKMSPRQFEESLTKYLVKYTPKKAIAMIISDLKKQALNE